MDAEQQAGLAGLLALVHDLLWWGGLVGVLALVRLSVAAARDGSDAGPPRGRAPRHPPSGARYASGHPGMVSTSLTVRPAPSPRPPPSASYADRLVLLAGLTAAASGVHAVMVLAHASGGPLQPLFFAVVAVVQTWQAGRLLVSPSDELLRGVVALDVGLLLVWGASRTVGLLGPPEALGPWDAAVVVWQVVCVVTGVRLLRLGGAGLPRPPLTPTQWGAGTQVALAMTALTLLLLPGAGHG